MKKCIFFGLLLVIILIPYVFAEQDEFSVRFHSFGKNATIDLKPHLGESEKYLVSQTMDVIVNIDQKKGIATLKARPNWEGSEVIFFRTNESIQKINDTDKIARFLPSVPEIFALRKIRDDELGRLFEGTIDPNLLDMVKTIKKAEIKKISSEIESNILKIKINDETELKMELGYIPAISMDFSLSQEKEVEEIVYEEGFKIPQSIIIAFFAILIIVFFYFYAKHSKKKKKRKKEYELEKVIDQDIKQLTLQKLKKLQKGEGNTDKFITIVREFFSRYFGIEYNFEFKYLITTVKKSDLSRRTKSKIIDFLEDLSRIVYYNTEEWSQIYGTGKISKKDQKLITRMKKIVNSL